MASFRGFGDDAMKVAAEQRQARMQMESIRAQERASIRSAAMQGASLAENARQADMANQRAAEKLAADKEMQAESLAAQASNVAEGRKLQEANLAEGARQFDIAQASKNRQLDLAQQGQETEAWAKVMGVEQNERQLELNEATYMQAEAERARQQAARENLKKQGVAAQLSAIRAAMSMSEPGQLDMMFINPINDARGIPYNAPGSLVEGFPIFDNNKAFLGLGTVKIGENGERIQSVLHPYELMSAVADAMPFEKGNEWLADTIKLQMTPGNDARTVAAKRLLGERKARAGIQQRGGSALINAANATQKELNADLQTAIKARRLQADPNAVLKPEDKKAVEAWQTKWDEAEKMRQRGTETLMGSLEEPGAGTPPPSGTGVPPPATPEKPEETTLNETERTALGLPADYKAYRLPDGRIQVRYMENGKWFSRIARSASAR